MKSIKLYPNQSIVLNGSGFPTIKTMQDVSTMVAAKTIVAKIMDSIDAQENPDNRIITDCILVPVSDTVSELWAVSNCDGWAESSKALGKTTHMFVPNDFIGLSESMAMDMLDVQCMPEIYEYVELVNPDSKKNYALFYSGPDDSWLDF